MRAAISIIAAISMAALCAGEAQAARHSPRHPARHAARRAPVPAAPAHRMSAMARQAQQQREARSFREDGEAAVAGVSFHSGKGEGRLGAFSRSYKLNDVYRPTIRPDQDGAVGLSFKLKTH